MKSRRVALLPPREMHAIDAPTDAPTRGYLVRGGMSVGRRLTLGGASSVMRSGLCPRRTAVVRYNRRGLSYAYKRGKTIYDICTIVIILY